MDETQYSPRIYCEVATKLIGVTLNALQFSTYQEHAEVEPHGDGIPRSGRGAFETVRTVYLTILIQQHGERRACLLDPAMGKLWRAKRDDHHFHAELPEQVLSLTQLCHMLSADKSSQVSKKDQQYTMPIAQQVAEVHKLAVDVGWREDRGNSAHPQLSLCHLMTPKM